MHLLSEYSIFRLRRVLSITVGVFCISLYSVGSFRLFITEEYFHPFLIGLAAVFLVLCAVYIMNDLCDLRYDMINRPEHIYIGRRIPLRAAAILASLLIFAGGVLSLFAAARFFLVLLAVSVLSAVYNLFSKRMSFLKPVVVSLLVVSIYPLSVTLTSGGNPSPRFDSLFIFPVWLFFTTLALEISADARDVVGDSVSAPSYIQKFGRKRAVRIAVAVALAASLIAYLPYVLGQCGNVYLAGTAAGSVLLVWGLSRRQNALPAMIHFNIVIVTLASLADILVYR